MVPLIVKVYQRSLNLRRNLVPELLRNLRRQGARVEVEHRLGDDQQPDGDAAGGGAVGGQAQDDDGDGEAQDKFDIAALQARLRTLQWAARAVRRPLHGSMDVLVGVAAHAVRRPLRGSMDVLVGVGLQILNHHRDSSFCVSMVALLAAWAGTR